MINLFQKIKIVYWSLCVLGILIVLYEFILIIVKWNSNPVPGLFFLYLILLTVYLYCVHRIFNKIATDKYIRIYKIFSDKCDPLKYIETIKNIIDINDTNYINTAIKLVVYLAYINLNQIDKAKKILDSISYFPANRYEQIYKKSYYSNLFIYYIKKNELKEAENVANEATNYIKCRLPKDSLEYKSLYNEFNCRLELEKGHYDGLEEYYTNQFKLSDCMLNNVNTKFTLGRIYMYCNKTNEAKEAFEYVIQHGNKLYVVQEAKKYLEQLS